MALGNLGEADSMRQEVRAKVKDVREVVDETLAKAAAKNVQAHLKVDELKTHVLSHWLEAQRSARRTDTHSGLCYVDYALTEALWEVVLMSLSLYHLLVRTGDLQDMLCLSVMMSLRPCLFACMCVLCLLW